VDLKKVNKRVIESLIKCGAFDSTGDYRSRMMASIEDILEYGQRVQREKSDPQMGLFEMSGSGPAINLPTLPQIDEWNEKQLLTLEKESLGFYITGHPLIGYEDILEKFTNANSVEVREQKDGDTVRIGGIIRKFKTIKTKKKGSLMAFITLEDLHGSVETTVFSSLYAKVHDLLTDDRPILIQGQLQKDENSVKILADTIIPIDKAEETWTASVHFNLDITRTQRELLVELKEILKSHPGSCRAYIHLLNPDKTETIVALPNSIKLRAGLPLTHEVNRFLGYNAVETYCKSALSTVKT
jgi:DNA polymerase-3 subunit alpha